MTLIKLIERVKTLLSSLRDVLKEMNLRVVVSPLPLFRKRDHRKIKVSTLPKLNSQMMRPLNLAAARKSKIGSSLKT